MTLSIIIYDTVYVSLSDAFGVRLYNIYCHKAMMDCILSNLHVVQSGVSM